MLVELFEIIVLGFPMAFQLAVLATASGVLSATWLANRGIA